MIIELNSRKVIKLYKLHTEMLPVAFEKDDFYIIYDDLMCSKPYKLISKHHDTKYGILEYCHCVLSIKEVIYLLYVNNILIKYSTQLK